MKTPVTAAFLLLLVAGAAQAAPLEMPSLSSLEETTTTTPDSYYMEEQPAKAEAAAIAMSGLGTQIRNYKDGREIRSQTQRRMCLPEWTFSFLATPPEGAIAAFEMAERAYLEGKGSIQNVYSAAKLLQMAGGVKDAASFAMQSNPEVVINNEIGAFTQKIALVYPGSTFSCLSGSGTINNGNIVTTWRNWDVINRVETAQDGLTYKESFGGGTVMVSVSDAYGGNGQAASAIIFLNDPKRTAINDIKLNLTASSSLEQLRGGRGVTWSRNELINAANEMYRKKYSNLSLTEYMAALLLRPDMKEELLKGGTKQ